MHIIQQGLLRLDEDNNVMEMKLSELAQRLNVDHLQQIKHHRDQLFKKGLIKRTDNPKAVISEDLGMASGLLRIPVLGAANAGPASIYAEGTVTGYLRLSDALLPKSIARSTLYALRVVGRSMNLAKIGAGKLPAEDGDYIIADGSTYEPKSNDYVVSLIDGKANIKKLILDVRNEQIALVSESTDDFPPIIISHDDNVEYLAQSKIVHVVKPPKAA
jgi:SOS-response transcriptional repressor LexA